MTNFIIGIAGTAKNTGKTTALAALLSEIRPEPGPTTALTSIGYDGEHFDNLTGLPKPRISVVQGEILAVAERCLHSGDAALEVLQKTDLPSPLGKIVIGRVTRPGQIVLAGPNKRRDLAAIIDRFTELGAGLTIVDGALSRIAPLAAAQALLLCTGAARHRDLNLLAAETKLVVEILKTPALKERGLAARLTSVLNRAGFDQFMAAVRKSETIHLDGIFSELYYSEFLEQAGDLAGRRLIFADSVKLLLSGDAGATRRLIDGLKAKGMRVGVGAGPNLAAVAVNPYYPKYRYDLKEYEAAYVDQDELLARLSAGLTVPVFDVVRQGGRGLYEALLGEHNITKGPDWFSRWGSL
ncbi:MAG: hypothetical protein LBP33_03915 [Candidatus Adiutrix sp.]|jgi:hypothetical protein|nr:hypothetical protein [Candidatus Adiutrix sp.]